MNLRYRVTLSAEERTTLENLVSSGKGRVRRLKRAQILLAADSGVSADWLNMVEIEIGVILDSAYWFLGGLPAMFP